MRFNRNEVKFGKSIEQPPVDEIKNTFGLWNASLDDALRYGGELTRVAIGAMDLKFDRKYIVVDTKVHMLIPHSIPAIGGWHNDGVPRGKELNPQAKQPPDIYAQEKMSDTRFHLLVTGTGCLTRFIKGNNIELDVPDVPDSKLYRMLDSQVQERLHNGTLEDYEIPSCTAVEFDWWDLHTAVSAMEHEWRYLIRVTETDHQPPQTDLRKIIRTQQNIYIQSPVGW